ncbi:type 2 periplasmic-binding domain-containing protein [Dongshaea marina]|uniref:hypothetical protein n=1 Tax=Dongshaea marina TaxID=2047966 RepID=UPI000D3E3437|nr:hypothetical protein [Dongshaea marina]
MENLHKLFEGKIDLFPINQCVGFFLIRNHFRQQLRDTGNSPHPLSVKEHYFLVSKEVSGAQELINSFNTGLRLYKEKDASRRVTRCFKKINRAVSNEG